MALCLHLLAKNFDFIVQSKKIGLVTEVHCSFPPVSLEVTGTFADHMMQ